MTYLFLFESFISAWALSRAMVLNSMNLLNCLIFLMIAILFNYVKKNCQILASKKFKIIGGTLSVILSVLYCVAEYETILLGLSSRLFILIIMGVTFIGLLMLFYRVLALLFTLCIEKKKIKTPLDKFEKLYKFFPFISFAFCFLMWLPWFLYSYPAILTPDSLDQIRQIVGTQAPSNHHPYIHTLTMKLFYNLGLKVFGSPNAAIATFIVFQILFLSFCAAFLVKTVIKFQREKGFFAPILITLFYALVPFNPVMAINPWKDSLFGGITLLFSCILFYVLQSGENTTMLSKISKYIFFPILAVAFCLYRSNGWYAFLLLVPFLLLAFWKKKKIFFALTLLVTIIVPLIKGPVMAHYNIKQPDTIESLCIPSQQIGRVFWSGKYISEDKRALVENVINTKDIKDYYVPYFADNMKELVRAKNQQYLLEHKKEFAILYLQMLLEYPDEYFKAYVGQTYGYYNPTSIYDVDVVEGVVPNELGLYRAPVIDSGLLLKLREIVTRLYTIVPLFGSLFSMGTAFFASLALTGLSVFRAKKVSYIHWLCFIPAIALILTLMLAAPVATEFRYSYGLMYTLPFLFFIGISYEATPSEVSDSVEEK